MSRIITSRLRRLVGLRGTCLCGGRHADNDVVEAVGVSSGIPANPKARTFKFQMVGKDYPAFAFRGMSNLKTKMLIRQAMASFSYVCGATFVESETSPNVRIYFYDRVEQDAFAIYAGNGAIHISRTRAANNLTAVICVQHEVGHFMGIWANPRSDSWGHCPDRSCIYNINGTGQYWCPACRRILESKYGPINPRGKGGNDGPSLHPMPKMV